jgi:hypothetical protein
MREYDRPQQLNRARPAPPPIWMLWRSVRRSPGQIPNIDDRLQWGSFHFPLARPIRAKPDFLQQCRGYVGSLRCALRQTNPITRASHRVPLRQVGASATRRRHESERIFLYLGVLAYSIARSIAYLCYVALFSLLRIFAVPQCSNLLLNSAA